MSIITTKQESQCSIDTRHVQYIQRNIHSNTPLKKFEIR